MHLILNFVYSFTCSSVQFSLSVMSDSLRPQGLQHARPPCPSSTLRACSSLCPSSQWCHPTISSFVVPFSSRLQSFPASGSFPMSQFFSSGGQCIGALASSSVLPMNIRDWFPLGWTGWNRWGNNGNNDRLYFFGSKLTADGDCSHEIKRSLLLGRKVMTNIDSILKSRDITLPTKVRLVKL